MGSGTKPSTNTLLISGEPWELDALRTAYAGPVHLTVTDSVTARMQATRAALRGVLEENSPVYGANTGTGTWAGTILPTREQEDFQARLVIAHMAGVGEPLPDGVVRAAMLIKILCLAQGHSAVRPAVLEQLVAMVNADCIPIVPSRGSVGASGDLAPLAHIAGAATGAGEVRLQGVRMPAADALAQIGRQPLHLEAKEGAALLNGTQVSTAQALSGVLGSGSVLNTALTATALSMAALGSRPEILDERVHRVRRQPGQIAVAAVLRGLLGVPSHPGPSPAWGVDPYSIRCTPQVLGAALDLVWQGSDTLLREANAVTDNPLLFAPESEIVNGGNFHAQPVAYAADIVALALAEIGSISERHTALLVDGRRSGLPDRLISGDGLDSGFNTAHVTASALVAENRSLATPSSVDSIPTSGSGQDHVSMSAYAALRLTQMVRNVGYIVAVELLAATQALELRESSAEADLSLCTDELDRARALVRSRTEHVTRDHIYAGDIESVFGLVMAGELVPSRGIDLAERG